MKLTLNTGTDGGLYGDITLPNDLLWVDEFKWVPAVQSRSYSLTGALLIETATKQAGRPITLSAQTDMAWVSRSNLEALRVWAALENRVFTLTLEYDTDTRTFTVMFDQEGDTAIEGYPVKDFPGHDSADWFTVKLKLIEV